MAIRREEGRILDVCRGNDWESGITRIIKMVLPGHWSKECYGFLRGNLTPRSAGGREWLSENSFISRKWERRRGRGLVWEMLCLFWLLVQKKKKKPQSEKTKTKDEKRNDKLCEESTEKNFRDWKGSFVHANNLFLMLTFFQRSNCSLFVIVQLNYCLLGSKCLSQMHTRVLLKHTVVSCLTDCQRRSSIGRLMNRSF